MALKREMRTQQQLQPSAQAPQCLVFVMEAHEWLHHLLCGLGQIT